MCVCVSKNMGTKNQPHLKCHFNSIDDNDYGRNKNRREQISNPDQSMEIPISCSVLKLSLLLLLFLKLEFFLRFVMVVTHTHTRNVTIHHETGQDACGLCVHKCVCAGKKNRTGTREKRIEMIHLNYDIDRDDIWNISFEL